MVWFDFIGWLTARLFDLETYKLILDTKVPIDFIDNKTNHFFYEAYVIHSLHNIKIALLRIMAYY